MPEMTTSQAIKSAISLCLDNYEEAFLAGEDIGIYGGAFGVTDGLLEKYGEERIKDTPISEDAIAGLGVGAAITGQGQLLKCNSAILLLMQWIRLLTKQPNCILCMEARLMFQLW